MNNLNIPESLENEIRDRDKKCVYCSRIFNDIEKPNWEHSINDETIISNKNIALYCRACNSSKGDKSLQNWLNTKYCLKNNINKYTVAEVVKDAIGNN